MIAIIDYQMGNLRSVQKAFEKAGYEATITDDRAVLADAEKIVLPGVGAFEDAIAQLNARKLVEPIHAAIDSGKPFLGICLGLQLLLDVSHEHGEHRGLGIIPGEVRRFDLPREYKVPHMGWNQVRYTRQPPIFEGIADESHFYFVHSYYVAPTSDAVISGVTDYGPASRGEFCSMIWRDNVYATQFHPEKSQAAGLHVLKNFASL